MNYRDRTVSSGRSTRTGKERDPWQQTNYLLMKGAQDGELYTFTTSSKGGLDAVAQALQGLRAVHGDQRPNEWPVIEIGHDSYAHPNKDFGRIKVPTFKIVGFAPKASFAPDLGEQHQVVMDDDALMSMSFRRSRPSPRQSQLPRRTGSREVNGGSIKRPAAGPLLPPPDIVRKHHRRGTTMTLRADDEARTTVEVITEFLAAIFEGTQEPKFFQTLANDAGDADEAPNKKSILTDEVANIARFVATV